MSDDESIISAGEEVEEEEEVSDLSNRYGALLKELAAFVTRADPFV